MMSGSPTIAAEHVPATPLSALEYATPLPAGARRSHRDLWLAIPAALFISGGVGVSLFGVLMATGLRDDIAGPIGGGAGCITFGGCLLGLMVWLRRTAR
jgi:hypothetical protein